MKPIGILTLSLLLFVPARTRAGGQVPGQTAAGAPLPDAATLAMHAALEEVLRAKASQITGPAQTPNGTSSDREIRDGAAFGDTIKMGLVLIKDATIAQFDQAQQQLAALKTASPADREAELAKIRNLAVEARDAYRDMRAIERDDLKGDMNGEARSLYDSTMRDADAAEKAGRHAEADALREKAAQTRWGSYLKARQRFFKAVGAHPLLGVRLAGGATDLFLDQTYFFNKVLESAVPRSGTGVSVATLLKLMDDHIDRANELLETQKARVVNMTTWKAVWELGGPAFEATQKQATGIGGDFTKGLVDAVTATNAGATAVTAYDDAWWETTLSIVQVGSMIVPGVGPFISAGITGIQVYKSGNDFVIALIDVKNATGSAPVTGQEAVADAKDRTGAAAAGFVVNIAMAPAEIPGLVDALKAGKVIVKRGATTLTRAAADAKGALTGTEDAAKAARAAEEAKAATEAKVATGAGDAGEWAPGRKPANDADALKMYQDFIQRQDTLGIAQEMEAEVRLAREAGMSEREIMDIVSNYNPKSRISTGNRIVLDDLLKARLEKLGIDLTMTAEEFNQLQGMSVRSGAKGAGLSEADLKWIERKLAADPDYFKKLSKRGYLTGQLRDTFVTKAPRPQEGFIGALDAESAAALEAAYKKSRGATGAAGLPTLPPTALVDASGRLISAEQAARLTTGELNQIPFDFVRQMDPRSPVTQALARRFADVGDATAKAWARDVLAAANAARATAASSPTPTGTSASAPAAPKPTGGLTPEEEKRAADAMSKETGMAPPTPTGDGFICGTDNCGTLTIDPDNLVFLTLPGGTTTYPGLLTDEGIRLYSVGTRVKPDAPPPASTYFGGFSPRIGFKYTTVGPNGKVTSKIPINGLARTPTGEWTLPLPTDPFVPGPLDQPGGFTFFPPPAKDKTGPSGGGDSTGGNTVGGGLPYAPPVPPGPVFGWGESETETKKPVEPEHVTAPAPGGGLVNLGGVHADPHGCCTPGVQPMLIDVGPDIDVEPRAQIADMRGLPRWPWSLRGVAAALQTLIAGVTSPTSARALEIANLPIALPPALTTQAPSRPGGGAAQGPPQLKTFIKSLGTSQGDAFDLQIVNEGLSAVRVRGSGVVVEPVKREMQEQMQKEMAKLAGGNAATRRVEAYCLAFGLKPPTPGMLFQIAAPDIQAKFAPARAVMSAGQKLSAAGLLHPDSSVKAYTESIKQYAIWTKVENWDVKRFADTWIEKTKANAAAVKQNWTREMETVLVSAAPGRWRDIQAILQEAQAQSAGAR